MQSVSGKCPSDRRNHELHLKIFIRQKINSLFQWNEKGAEVRKIKRENINLKALHKLNCFENNNWEII